MDPEIIEIRDDAREIYKILNEDLSIDYKQIISDIIDIFYKSGLYGKMNRLNCQIIIDYLTKLSMIKLIFINKLEGHLDTLRDTERYKRHIEITENKFNELMDKIFTFMDSRFVDE